MVGLRILWQKNVQSLIAALLFFFSHMFFLKRDITGCFFFLCLSHKYDDACENQYSRSSERNIVSPDGLFHSSWLFWCCGLSDTSTANCRREKNSFEESETGVKRWSTESVEISLMEDLFILWRGGRGGGVKDELVWCDARLKVQQKHWVLAYG